MTSEQPANADNLDSEHARLRTDADNEANRGILQRSLSAVMTPFSSTALATLPRLRRPARYTRADDIPDAQRNEAGQLPTVRDYHSINLPPQVRVPKKIPTSVKVEGKVWFANERTWVSWLNISVLLGTLALGLFNASKDEIARRFAYVYAFISVCVLVYGYLLYQHRISMIQRRDPGHFDALAGPVILSIALFVAVLANFVIRGTSILYPLKSTNQTIYPSGPIFNPDDDHCAYINLLRPVRELQNKGVPIPGAQFVAYIMGKTAFSSDLAHFTLH